MLNYEEIQQYWDQRAASDQSTQSTTQDVYLREIEVNALSERIEKYSPKLVADIGCGDGRTTARLASKFKDPSFSGLDYSPAMIENAQQVNDLRGLHNISFQQHDISNKLSSKYNLIYTTRCLINLPSWDLQKQALENIHTALYAEGIYLMIENFKEGHDNFNQIRQDFGLDVIAVRDHNYFFQRQQLLDYLDTKFDIEEEINISSTYYLMSRIVYSKICSKAGVQPDYFNDHHKYAAGLPFCGEYGPVRLMCLRKK